MDTANLTLGELINKFHGYIKGKRRKPDTQTAYRQHLNQYLKFAGADALVDRITVADIDDYRADMVERGLADASINSYLRSVKVMFRYAHTRKLVNEVPLVEFISSPPLRPKSALGREEVDKLVAAALTEPDEVLRLRNKALVLVMYITGVRVSELSRACMSAITSKEYQGEVSYLLEWRVLRVDHRARS